MKGQQRVTYLIHTIGTGINHQNLIRNVVVRKIIMYKLNIIQNELLLILYNNKISH